MNKIQAAKTKHNQLQIIEFCRMDLMRIQRGIQARKNNRFVSWFKKLTIIRILRMRGRP